MTPDRATESDDALMQALVVGDKTPDDADVARQFAERPELAVRWRKLEQTLDDVSLLKELGEDLADDREVAPVDAGAAIRQFRKEQVVGMRPNWRPMVFLAAAAALILAVVLIDWSSQPKSDPMLGGKSQIELRPDGEPLVAGGTFLWTTTLAFSSFEIEFRDLESGEWSKTVGELLEPRWHPSESDIRDLPQRFRWRVIGRDASGGTVVSAWAQSSRE